MKTIFKCLIVIFISLIVALMSCKDGDDTGGVEVPCVESTIPGVSIADSGQSDDHISTFGEDSDYSKPYARSFNGPEQYGSTDNYITVDNVTGLTWKTCSEGQTFDAASSSCTETVLKLTWEDAGNACSSLGSANYGGSSDWRLPSIYELITIVDFGTNRPAINETHFPGTPLEDTTEDAEKYKSTIYWSSSEFRNPQSAYVIYFEFGSVLYSPKVLPLYVRCVSSE